jgi:ribosomal protein S18 acetylase RimI-like enzyme
MIKDFANLPGFTLRDLAPSDLTTYVELGLPTCAFMHGRPHVSEDQLRKNFVSFIREHAFEPESEIYVVETPEHRVIAQLWLHVVANRFSNVPELWIWDLTVHEEYRHRGIGAALLNYAFRRAKELECEELWLLVSSKNDRAVRIYQTAGMKAAGLLMAVTMSEQGIKPAVNVELKYSNLRPLLPVDIYALYELWTAAGLAFKPRGRDSEDRLKRHLGGASPGGWGIFEEQKLVAAAIVSNDGRKGWIERLASLPTHRRTGLAKVLVTAATQRFREDGLLIVAALIAKDNAASRKLFEACGYKADEDYLYYSIRDSNEC